VDRVAPAAQLVAALRAALPDAHALPVHTSAAVGGVRNSSAQAPLVEAMEGFGVLRAAALAGVPGVEVRAISNEIGEDDRARWDIDAALAALALALPTMTGVVREVLAAPGTP
jgi:futalosine hydrolase